MYLSVKKCQVGRDVPSMEFNIQIFFIFLQYSYYWGRFLKSGGVFLRGEIGVFRQHISKKRLLKLFWRKKCVVELVKFANTFPQMRMVFDFPTHVGGHAWRNIVTNIIADSESHKLTSVTILTIVMLSLRLTSLPVYPAWIESISPQFFEASTI